MTGLNEIQKFLNSVTVPDKLKTKVPTSLVDRRLEVSLTSPVSAVSLSGTSVTVLVTISYNKRILSVSGVYYQRISNFITKSLKVGSNL